MTASKNPELFEKYFYGMSKKDLVELTRAHGCDGASDDSLVLCAPNPTHYLQQDWQQVFYFNNLDELQQVLLAAKGGNATQFALIQQRLVEQGWQPVFLESDSDALDLLSDCANCTPEERNKLLDSFEEKAIEEGGNLIALFFPAAYFESVVKKNKNMSYSQALDQAGENFVVTSLMFNEDNLKLSFTAPLLSRKNALRYGEKIKR